MPLLSGTGGGIAVVLLNRHLEQQQSLAISVLGLDDAEIRYYPDEPPSDPPRQIPFPGADSDTRFTYLTTLRNAGDFSAEDVSLTLDFRVRGLLVDPAPEGPLADPQVIFSLPLIQQNIVTPLTRQGLESYLLRLSLLHPGEAVAVQISWRRQMRVSAEARSTTLSVSQYY